MTMMDEFFSVVDFIEGKFNTGLPGLVATVIERNGIYTWDLYGRFVKAEDDRDDGWYCYFDEETQSYTVGHDNPHNASHCTVSAALALLAAKRNREIAMIAGPYMPEPHIKNRTLETYGWTVSELPVFSEVEKETARDPAPPIPKLVQQIDAILDAIKSIGYKPLLIPEGGKAAIKKRCLENSRLFSVASFEHAWKAGKKATPQRWEMENIEKYQK